MPPKPNDADLNRLFPARNPDPGAGVFELGLVLGGTVSAGAYTAGVLDFLIEALDAWDVALANKDASAAPSKVVLKVVGGTSGGAVVSAILARLTPYAFPHIAAPTDSTSTGNPLFDVWVNMMDVRPMLDTSDLKNNQVPSALNVAPIDNAGRMLLRYVGHPLGDPGSNTVAERRWLDETLTVFMTLTNLRGMPYQIDFTSATATNPKLSQGFVNHGDFARFNFDTRAGAKLAPREDSFAISLWRDGTGFFDWSVARDYAIASGAFPIGFIARDLSRPISQYAYRPITIPDASGGASLAWLRPYWEAFMDQNGNMDPIYTFPSVDGGAIDNAPVELVRCALTGSLNRTPRDGTKTNRAVLLIDPFAEGVNLGPPAITDLEQEVLPLVSGMIGQTRYDTADLMLAADESVFSRFMLTAVRGEYVGSEALATAGLGAFQGFLCRAFRQHDYLLGRRNAYDFLKNQFLLPADNALFNGWSTPQKTQFKQTAGGKDFLPLVPLLGSAANPPTLPAWPAGALNPDELSNAITNRIKAVVSSFENQATTNIFIHAYLWPAITKLRSNTITTVMTKIKQSLAESHL